MPTVEALCQAGCIAGVIRQGESHFNNEFAAGIGTGSAPDELTDQVAVVRSTSTIGYWAPPPKRQQIWQAPPCIKAGAIRRGSLHALELAEHPRILRLYFLSEIGFDQVPRYLRTPRNHLQAARSPA